MCNEVARRIALDQLREDWSETRIPLRFPDGAPNMAPLDSIRITDPTVILRADSADGVALVTRRWSWPGAAGRPVYNYRADGRDLRQGRCLIPVSCFFEFTAPPPAAGKRARKTKWAFARPDRPWFCIAGIWRSDATVGESFAMLTCPPGPDISPYHGRQVVTPDPADWASWLDGSASTDAICRPAPGGTFVVEQVG